VGAHLPLAPQAHAVALLGLREDDGRLAFVARGRMVGGVDLHRIVAAALEPIDVLVAHVGDQLAQLGVLVEEMLAVEAAVGRGVGLELAVDRLVEALEQHAVVVAGEERIPVRAPEKLEHIPAGAGEETLQLLHHRAVAAHRAVEALQIAVDDEDQVVEAFARRERKPGERFGLVHLAVADERPHLSCLFNFKNSPVGQVADEPRLVDRIERAKAHRAGGELPEVRHQVRMAIGGEPLAAGFLPVVVQPLFAEPAFQERARIDAGRRMRLEIDQIVAAEEVVEADLEEIRRRGVAGDVAAKLRVRAVGAHHHGERVPAHDGRNAGLDLQVPRELRLLGERDRVLVRRIEDRRQRHAPRARVVEELAQQEGGALAPFRLDQRVEGVQPLPGLGGIGVRRVHPPESGSYDVGQVGHPAMVAPPSGRVTSQPPEMLLESGSQDIQAARICFFPPS